MSVYKKLQDARIKLQSIQMKKSGHNKFAGYQYFELGDFLTPIQQIFNEVGLCGVVSFSADTATLRIVDVDQPEQSIEFTSPMGSAALKGCHEVQNIGAVETYQRRYLYVTALEIVEHDALEAVTGKPENKEEAKISAAATKLAKYIGASFAKGDEWSAFEAWELENDNEVKQAVWSMLDSKIRSTIKTMKDESKQTEKV